MAVPLFINWLTGQPIPISGSVNAFSTVVANTTITQDYYGATIFVSGSITLGFDSAASLGAGWFIRIVNVGTRRITLEPDGSETIDSSSQGFMYPIQGYIIASDGGNLYTVGKPTRWRNSNTVIYTSTTGNDSNDGLISGSPKALIQTSIDFIINDTDQGNGTGTVSLADGTYDQRFQLVSDVVGGNQVIVTGSASVNIAPTTGGTAIVYIKDKGILTLNNMNLSSATAAFAIQAEQYAICDLNGVNVGAMTIGSHFCATGQGRLNILSNYNITGGAVAHLFGDDGGIIKSANNVATLSGTPAFTYFSLFEDGAIYKSQSNTYSGGATGQRYLAQLNGVINTNGGGANYFPGNVAGATATGGQYV